MRSLLMMMVLLGVAAGACTGCLAALQRPLTTEAQRLDRAVEVTSVCVGDTVKFHSGSGVIVDSQTVLTAVHVVACLNAEVTVTTVARRSFKMRVALFDSQADVARLTLDSGRFAATRVPIGRVLDDDPVCIVPAVPNRAISCGEVKPNPYPDHPLSTNHTAVTIPGNSGSGTYDCRGRLVGIVTNARLKDNSGGLFTPVAPRPWLLP